MLSPAPIGRLGLPDLFTTAHIADGLGRPRWFAQKVAYCLRAMAAVQQVGKLENAILYTRTT